MAGIYFGLKPGPTRMNAPVKSARQKFYDEVRVPDGRIDLATAALRVAEEEYPGLPVAHYLGVLDLWATEVRDRLNGETAPLVVLDELLDHLFQRRALQGSRRAYYDPRNSFLSDVIDRRMGIPLTLGIVLIEVGRRLGLPLTGVNFRATSWCATRVRRSGFSSTPSTLASACSRIRPRPSWTARTVDWCR